MTLKKSASLERRIIIHWPTARNYKDEEAKVVLNAYIKPHSLYYITTRM